MSPRGLPARKMFYLVALVTLVLLLGSAALQRIVFKADQATSSVFLTPAAVAIKSNETATVTVGAQIGGTAAVATAQFTLQYDPAVVAIGQLTPAQDWQTAKLTTDNGVIEWAIIPRADHGAVWETTGPVTFGQIELIAKANGTDTLHFDSAKTIIAAVDASQSPSLYNAVTSVQNTALTVADTVATTPSSNLPDEAEVADESGLQKVVSIEELPTATASWLLIHSTYSAVATVTFGQEATALTSSVESNSQTAFTAVRLAGLTPSTHYFYQVTLNDAVNHTKVRSNVRSFTTAAASTNLVPGRIEARAFPQSAISQSALYMATYDAQGAAIGDGRPAIQLTQGTASVSSVAGSEGLYQATLSSKLNAKQTVVARAALGSVVSQSMKISFDPNRVVKQESASTNVNDLPFNREVQLFLVGLVIGLLILGLAFWKLAKLK